MNEEEQKPKGKPGPVPFPDELYQKWLEEMAPYLKLGNSLYYAMEKADLAKHKDAIYDKKKENDWFSEKILAYQRTPGEILNKTIVNLINAIADKISQGGGATDEDKKFLLDVAKVHRSAQPFFVTRNETADVTKEPVGQILDTIEAQTDYGKLGREARRQMVADNPPVQDKDENG